MTEPLRPRTIEDLTALLRSGWVPDDEFLAKLEAAVDQVRAENASEPAKPSAN